ncbi:hypothetical protein RhiirA4_421648 [Rhizophagus irregularis]|uniref:Uncharacterized protein n=1 Tax=Rhizophagus irregularis TaxID=588596 RepID=A0A2I1GMB3_9GLOM|nr:hypothetical protein RhiirA4_421648 [Rhizophagus irregularis]
MKKDVCLRLTIRKNKPLSEEQARGIRPDIEELLTREKIKIEANTASDGSSTLSRLDGFEKRLEEREALLKQKENNIKITIEAQAGEERKRLKDEYDALKLRLESEYNKSSARRPRSAKLEKQYKSRISTLEKAMVEKDREVGKLSSAVFQAKKDKNDLKKSLSSAKKTIKLLDNIIFAKDQTIIAYNEGIRAINPSCIDDTIEPTSFYEKDARDLWKR